MTKTKFVKEIEPGIGLYKYDPDNPNEEGTLRYLPGNPQGKTPGGAVSLHTWMRPIKTSEEGKAMSERAKEKKQQALEDGIREAVEEGRGITLSQPSEALKYIAKAQTELALSPDMGMPSVKAAELLLKAVDALPDPRYQLQSNAMQIIINVDSKAIDEFAKQEQILDGQFREAD